ncbi:3-dehydroquinate synthase [Betaproteobacteria bacterium]|nr:3-dehydroquinate synthase [Betaproteobacteria bacterium]
MNEFYIDKRKFNYSIENDFCEALDICSYPDPYSINFLNHGQSVEDISNLQKDNEPPVILIDNEVKKLFFTSSQLDSRTYLVTAVEENKEIQEVLKIVDFYREKNVTKKTSVIVIGGGILQDLGAFSTKLYKRGIPWIYFPTTLLSQSDSCCGGKTAINYGQAKNLLGLFSAPKKVMIDLMFNKSLGKDAIFSGLGEVLRLCITGGYASLSLFEKNLGKFLEGDEVAIRRLIEISLKIKKLVVECDEFDKNHRRSMNYGHSIGHALEAMTNYKIPHGVGVSIGILVENEIAEAFGLLNEMEKNKILKSAKKIIPKKYVDILVMTKTENIISLLKLDKKTEGKNLILASLEKIGAISFIKFELNDENERLIDNKIKQVISYFN